jgi:hypothetical protein
MERLVGWKMRRGLGGNELISCRPRGWCVCVCVSGELGECK